MKITSLLASAIITLILITATHSQAQSTPAPSVYFRNTSENTVKIWVQVSQGNIPYEGGVGYVDNVEIEPGQSVNIETGDYWHLYLCGTDLVTGESWDNDFNPEIHVPGGIIQLDWVGAFNGGGFTVSDVIDPNVLATAKDISLGLGYVNGSFIAN